MHWYDLPELLPPVYRNVKAMYWTAYAENIELLNLKSLSEKALDNFFVQTCDLPTLEYWEDLLDIKLYGSPTIEERRQMILFRLMRSERITVPYVRTVMRDLFGANNYEFFEIEPFVFAVYMYDAAYSDVERFLDWLYKVAPAHVQLDAARSDRMPGELFISSISPGEYLCSAQASLSIGNGSIFLGQTEYSNIQWVEI